MNGLFQLLEGGKMSASSITRRIAPVFVAAIFAVLLAGGAPAQADQGFHHWVASFRSVALSHGVSRSTFDRAFRNVTEPDPDVLEKSRSQPEFNAPAWNYFDNRVQEESVADGQAMARKWRPWLDRIEKRFGVSRYVLLAIWSMESNYGETLKNDKIMRNVVRSLATLGYGSRRYSSFARKQLIAALKILQRGDIDERHLTGSWAGAMGQTQFIPTSYEIYAVDMDGDGRRDIWDSIPDALATTANLLARNGWQADKTWGYEVKLPAGRKFPSGFESLDRWAALGVTRATGKDFPRGHDRAALKLPDGRDGPVFLMLKNFYVIKKYNNADRYALAVGLLADQIAGYGGLVQDWDRPFVKLSFDERRELQKRLLALGYYDGKIDGRIGDGSRSAIKAFQAQAGLAQDGNPSQKVLTSLRQR
jgi:membrane-bound lytic murein transglycosylase B